MEQPTTQPFRPIIADNPMPEQCQSDIIHFSQSTYVYPKVDLKPYRQVVLSHSAN